MTSLDPPLAMALLWLSFAASHVGIALDPIRGPIIRRFGKVRYFVGYAVVAQLWFAVLPVYYSAHEREGPAGWGVSSVPWARAIAMAATLLGVVLMVSAAAPKQYLVSAVAPLLPAVRPAYGLERITRHPFFAGITLVAIAHALLAERMIGAVFFGGFAVLATLGPLHQARKVTAEKGPDYARYLESTSAIPFVAILTGKQTLGLREQPWLFIALGLGFAAVLRSVHPNVMAWSGLGFALFFAIVTGYFVIAQVRASRP